MRRSWSRMLWSICHLSTGNLWCSRYTRRNSLSSSFSRRYPRRTCTARLTWGQRQGKRRGDPMPYVPSRGDAVWITLNPQAGHEQSGRRPALVLSPSAYNGRVGLALLCPITSQVKGYPFEVTLPHGLPITGVVLADEVKSLDWRARK